MGRAMRVAFVLFVLASFGCGILSAQYDDGGSSMSSSDLAEGREEMNQMDSSMNVQPGDSLSSLSEKGMDVQPGDSMDSQGTGAH